METDPHRRIAELRHSQDRLATLVAPLTPAHLRSPSYHDWTIAEVRGHLGSQAQLLMGWHTAAIELIAPVTLDDLRLVFPGV
jgi:hypothetical protein